MRKLKWWLIRKLLSNDDRLLLHELILMGVTWKEQDSATSCDYYSAQNEQDDINRARQILSNIAKKKMRLTFQIPTHSILPKVSLGD